MNCSNKRDKSATGAAMTAKERPISFSAPMVQAILDGRKTMTRRVINKLTGFGRQITEFSKSDTPGYDFCFRDKQMRLHDVREKRGLECCPYGRPGDRLWVREAFNVVFYGGMGGYDPISNIQVSDETFAIKYKAMPGYVTEINIENKNHPHYEQLYRLSDSGPDGNKFRSSRFMPRWASRILLEVTDVKIERLLDISQGDAQQEGPKRCPSALRYWFNPGLDGLHNSAKQAFAALWNDIYGPGAWDANPFVWVISFKRIEP